MCAAFPSQGVISATMPKPLSATMPRPLSALMQATPVAKRRVTFASSPFTTHFDHNSFIDHLNLQVRIFELQMQMHMYSQDGV